MASDRSIFKALFTDPPLVSLMLELAALALFIYAFSFQLIPFVAALLFAFFLEGGIQRLKRLGMTRWPAMLLVFSSFMVAYIALIVLPLPLILQRMLNLAQHLPTQVDGLLDTFSDLPDWSFGMLDAEQKQGVASFMVEQVQSGLEPMLQSSLSALPQLTGWAVYIILVPLLVFFFLKDKPLFLTGLSRMLPQEHELLRRIWQEVQGKLANYVQGKIWEIVIVGLVTWITFATLDFGYPAMLGMITGLSVVIPYVGAFAVTVPVFILGYLQWGWSLPLGWLMLAYLIIQLLDGNVLVPLIFSEAVKLHPVFILLAVFLFGSIWGIWGAFFAIPLATFVKALVGTVIDYREEARQALLEGGEDD